MFNWFRKEENKMENSMFDAKNFAAYISKYYFDKSNRKISPIKLQKALYFCFAYWGSFVKKGSENKEISEFDVSLFCENLFDNRIEAWVYGPVVPDVYHEKNIDSCYEEDLFRSKEYVKEYIDGILDDVLDVSDFRLVEISHCDLCWKKNFSTRSFFHDKEIPKKEIINEYVRKQCS